MGTETTTKQRLLAFISTLGISQAKFEKSCGMSTGYINNISKGIGSEKLLNISEKYPQLNTSWLINGEGEMLRSQPQPSVVITGDGVTAATNSSTATSGLPTGTIDKLIARQNELISQQSRLISIIERMQAQHEVLVGLQQKRGSEEP